MAADNLTPERAREILEYNPVTGEFHWKIKKLRSAVGDKAGGLNAAGYVQIVIDGRPHYGHRLAWLITHGRWPEQMTDHLNGVRSDNRLSNLREVSSRMNCENKRSPQKNNRNARLLGVTRSASNTNSWVAAIKANGQRLHLGSYATPEIAHAAYLEAKRRLHAGCTI